MSNGLPSRAEVLLFCLSPGTFPEKFLVCKDETKSNIDNCFIETGSHNEKERENSVMC